MYEGLAVDGAVDPLQDRLQMNESYVTVVKRCEQQYDT